MRHAQMPILITGASGHVGGSLANALTARVEMRLTGRGLSAVALDFLDAQTVGPALLGCNAIFLIRPPQIVSSRTYRPLLDAASAVGVRRMVVLPVKGPRITAFCRTTGWSVRSSRGFDWTMLRPADFIQALGPCIEQVFACMRRSLCPQETAD